jgi:hypothetical protein
MLQSGKRETAICGWRLKRDTISRGAHGQPDGHGRCIEGDRDDDAADNVSGEAGMLLRTKRHWLDSRERPAWGRGEMVRRKLSVAGYIAGGLRGVETSAVQGSIPCRPLLQATSTCCWGSSLQPHPPDFEQSRWVGCFLKGKTMEIKYCDLSDSWLATMDNGAMLWSDSRDVLQDALDAMEQRERDRTEDRIESIVTAVYVIAFAALAGVVAWGTVSMFWQ